MTQVEEIGVCFCHHLFQPRLRELRKTADRGHPLPRPEFLRALPAQPLQGRRSHGTPAHEEGERTQDPQDNLRRGRGQRLLPVHEARVERRRLLQEVVRAGEAAPVRAGEDGLQAVRRRSVLLPRLLRQGGVAVAKEATIICYELCTNQ